MLRTRIDSLEHDTRMSMPPHGHSQTDRMSEFSARYLLYPRKESQIAIQFWRHKLMHTAELRILRDSSTKETYVWSMGTSQVNHMQLVEAGEPNKWVLHFSPFVFIRDLREAIFGPSGYFNDLRTNAELQSKYLQCLAEFEIYEITLKL